MNKNQKIAVGCGAAGCLGLIVVAIAAGALIYWRSQHVSPVSVERSFPTNSNSDRNSNANTNSESSGDGTTATYSDDEKHKLFQAASMTQDADLLQRVVKKLGLFKTDGTPADEYPEFIKDHISWGLSNTAFISSINTPEKARAYVDEHLKE